MILHKSKSLLAFWDHIFEIPALCSRVAWECGWVFTIRSRPVAARRYTGSNFTISFVELAVVCNGGQKYAFSTHYVVLQPWRHKCSANNPKDLCSLRRKRRPTVKKRFARFKAGNFNLEDEPRSGRPNVVETDEVVSLATSNSGLTMKEIEDVTGLSHGIVWNRLRDSGFSCKRIIWPPDDLNDKRLKGESIPVTHSSGRTRMSHFWGDW